MLDIIRSNLPKLRHWHSTLLDFWQMLCQKSSSLPFYFLIVHPTKLTSKLMDISKKTVEMIWLVLLHYDASCAMLLGRSVVNIILVNLAQSW